MRPVNQRAAQRGAVSVARVSVQRARKDPGADPGSCIARHAAGGLGPNRIGPRCTTSCGFLLVFDGFSVLFVQLFYPETEQPFTSNPLLFPRSGHVSQP